MPIVLAHMIVPAHDNEASGRVVARIVGLQFAAPVSHFAPVRVNDVLVLDGDTRTTFEPHDYAFKVSDRDFDASFQRIEREGIAYGCGSRLPDGTAINRRAEGRGSTSSIRTGICWRY